MVQTVLRLEGFALFLAAVWFYFFRLNAPWWLFLLLLLAPDLSMVGYLHNARWGAISYNVVHNYVLVAGLLIGGSLLGSTILLELGLILLAHLGMDHLLGFGLKYPSRFQDTHLQRV